jgi:LmbE family N-acetylglucosaminyl deacetylase
MTPADSPATTPVPLTTTQERLIERRLRPRFSVISDAGMALLNTPISTLLQQATTWVRRGRDARAIPPQDVANQILTNLTADATAPGLGRRVAVIVAHPDDEAIGAGAVLRGIKDATIVHVTDGAPADEEYARRKGFESRLHYARARRREVVNALSVIGVSESRIRGMGFIDGEVAWRLVDLCNAMMALFDELRPEVVVTHPYEGGHSDHDSTAFAVHLAAGILAREGLEAPIILELTSYHNYNGKRRLFNFLPTAMNPIRTVRLSVEAQRTKRQMFEFFTSQRALLASFPIEVERFRQAPRYLFTVPPHDGQLDYERLCKKISGAEWRAQAERALTTLRTKRQFRGVGEGTSDSESSSTA